MALLVDTSVWSLALRRNQPIQSQEVKALAMALTNGESVVTTGLILQELLQGFVGPKARDDLIERFRAIPLLMPDRQDHIAAVELRNHCRRAGVQVGTIDALIAQLCIRHDLMLLTTDGDFRNMAMHVSLSIWQ